jgi:hypothetical protein
MESVFLGTTQQVMRCKVLAAVLLKKVSFLGFGAVSKGE